MECKRCGGTDHPNARWLACPENLITKKIASWDGNCLADCVITDAVIAGFMDADGTIGFYPRLQISMSQAHHFGKDLLDLISTYINSGSVTGPIKNELYTLRWYGANANDIYEVMVANGVIKGTVGPRLYNITDEWIGGFFAGDGSARKTKSCCYVSLGQESSPSVLYAIKDYLGYGTVYGDREWTCCGANARAFALRFKDFALHKRSDLINLL